MVAGPVLPNYFTKHKCSCPKNQTVQQIWFIHHKKNSEQENMLLLGCTKVT